MSCSGMLGATSCKHSHLVVIPFRCLSVINIIAFQRGACPARAVCLVQAALRRASADHELVQSEARRNPADERQPVSNQKHLKKKSWFMKLFTGQNRSRA